MSVAYELEKLRNLRDSGAITPTEFEQSRNRLLDDCVQRIEASHPEKREAAAQVERPPVSVTPAQKITGEIFQEPQKRPENGTQRPPSTPRRTIPAIPVRREALPAKPAGSMQQVRFRSMAASAPAPALEQPAPVPALEQATPVPALEQTVSSAALEEAGPPPAPEQAAPPAGTIAPKEPRAANPEEIVESPPPDRSRPLFEDFYEPQPRARWGLPQVRVKIVRGVVQKINLSQGKADEKYTASVEVDGQQAEITSRGSIGIDPGDRVALGGYERNGKLLAVAYHNESTGDYADLSRLRKGYRVLLITGRMSLGAGLAAIASTLILLILHRRAGAFDAGLWGYVPYALSALGAAAISYLGMGLSFLGSRAREFHDAMILNGLSAGQP